VPRARLRGVYYTNYYMALFFNIAALLFAVLTGAAYWWGVEESLLWLYPWYDTLLHVLGGGTFGLWAAAVAARLRLRPNFAFVLMLGVVLGVGVLWEAVEYAAGLTTTVEYWPDTLSDVANDCVGMLVAWVLYRLIYRP